MRNDPPLMEELRASLRSRLPEGATLKRDRGSALFVTDAAVEESQDFTTEHRGRLNCISPSGAYLLQLEERFPDPPNAFSASLTRFRGGTPEPETVALFIRGLKLLESSTPAERRLFDADVRAHAAVRLRLHASGGGLYALGILDSLLDPR